MSLHQTVDFFLYCNALSEITHIEVDDIIIVVKTIFKEISDGKIDCVQGFEKIEDELYERMGVTILPQIEASQVIKQKVC